MTRELEAYTTDKKNDFPKRERRAHCFFDYGERFERETGDH